MQCVRTYFKRAPQGFSFFRTFHHTALQQQNAEGEAAIMKSKTAISKAKKDLNNLLNPIKMAVRPGPNNVQYMNKFQAKEVYKPRDLNEGNQKTQESLFGEKRSIDPFKRLGINPLHEYKNSRILSEYVTEMGRIKPKYMTKLSAKSQRKVAKAIRRARAFGIMPFTYRPKKVLNMEGAFDAYVK